VVRRSPTPGSGSPDSNQAGGPRGVRRSTFGRSPPRPCSPPPSPRTASR